MSNLAEHQSEQAALTARYEALTAIGRLAHELGASIETSENVDDALAYCAARQETMDALQLRTLDEARADANEDATKRTFTVYLEITDHHQITVEAANEDAAEQLAKKTISDQDGDFGETFISTTGFEVTDCDEVGADAEEDDAQRAIVDTDNPAHMLDTVANLRVIWAALEAVREDLIPEGDPNYDAQWNEITSAMSSITEELGLDPQEV